MRRDGCWYAALVWLLAMMPVIANAGVPVVLLHGLARSADSMQPMAKALAEAGFRPCNVDYPSRHHSIEVLASEYVAPAVRDCLAGDAGPVHFVTHSLGGILVRQLAATEPDLPIGRVVMLAPPNGGSEVVDAVGDWAPFRWLNGPAGQQLGTAPESLPRRLGPAPFTLGVLAGSRSINWILSTLIPGEDDGKVSIAHTRLAGMADFRVLKVSHPFIMKDAQAIALSRHFLQHGRFGGTTVPGKADRQGEPDSGF